MKLALVVLAVFLVFFVSKIIWILFGFYWSVFSRQSHTLFQIQNHRQKLNVIIKYSTTPILRLNWIAESKSGIIFFVFFKSDTKICFSIAQKIKTSVIFNNVRFEIENNENEKKNEIVTAANILRYLMRI